jgi:hypothetical protein
VEEAMKKQKLKLPNSDSIQELAVFWDSHDVTDFEDELVEVPDRVFARRESNGRPPAIPSYLLNLAGEYRVCSELNKRGIFATVTYGTHKGVDVYAISDRKERALKIEVKTSQRGNFVTSITQKCLAEDPAAPDFWVLFQIQPTASSRYSERFFVLTHKELCKVQSARNAAYSVKYRSRHGKDPDLSKGVDNVTVADVKQFEDAWSKIIDRMGVQTAGSSRQVV